MPISIAMHLSTLSDAKLVIRQLGADFCPICSTCRGEVMTFSKASACIANSSFYTNCGGCQQCLADYKTPTGDALPEVYQAVLTQVLNLCANSTTDAQISSYQAQASRLAIIADIKSTSTGLSVSATSTSATSTSASTPISTTQSSPLAESSEQARQEKPLNKIWIVGPAAGSVIALAFIILLTVYVTKIWLRKANEQQLKSRGEGSGDGDNNTANDQAELHGNAIELHELENAQVYELAAPEPVGTELHTPREGKGEKEDIWPLPVSPLRALFVMSILRDQRRKNEEPIHNTYYNR
ncbi:hypothetical protein B0O99DRAFT_319748 [Bisporella sp. PMI_857]|nr:hypothetical protein B0O99DRAFT_319748 [Bisporella sp. PMI_857]